MCVSIETNEDVAAPETKCRGQGVKPKHLSVSLVNHSELWLHFNPPDSLKSHTRRQLGSGNEAVVIN